MSDVDWLRRRYIDDQAPVSEIAAEAGVHPATVHRWIAAAGIDRRGPVGQSDTSLLTRRRLAAWVRQGWSTRRIAAETGLAPTTVAEHLARHGLRTSETSIDVDEAAALYRAGMSLPAVAERVGCHPRTVRRHLLAAGVEMRPRGRPASA